MKTNDIKVMVVLGNGSSYHINKVYDNATESVLMSSSGQLSVSIDATKHDVLKFSKKISSNVKINKGSSSNVKTVERLTKKVVKK